MNRREFIYSSAIAALAARTRISGAVTAPNLIPAIDTHTHFYDPTRPQGVPWPPANDNLLYKPHLPADFRAATANLNILGTVVVEASKRFEDNDWILELAKSNPIIVGFVGSLEPGKPEFADNLKHLSANPLFRGLRMNVRNIEQADDPSVLADLKRIVDLDLSVDLIGGSAVIAPTLKLSRLFPGLRIIVEHLPFKDWDDDPAAIRPALKEIARQPNVFAKISNVVRREKGQVIDDPAYYSPALDALGDLFGPDRIVYGSNWPVSKRVGSYAMVRKVVSDYFATKDRLTAEKFFWRNSHVAYRWLPRGQATVLIP